MTLGVAAASASTAVSTVTFGKRRHDESYGDGAPEDLQGHEMPPPKRTGNINTTGVLAARSVARTRRKPAAKIPQMKINREPKEVGSGTRKLPDPNSQGNHHLPSLGPRFPQGWAEEDADGRLIWVEESVEEEVVGQVQQDKLFEIPQDFEIGHKALLAATQADWARGAVKEIKCRVCPKTQLDTWGQFKRHCETTEAHPLKIDFCNNCGDFFARSDSLKRHCEHPPAKCLSTPPEKANKKRRKTKGIHDKFKARLEGSLGTSENIGMSFSLTVKNIYPASSKKRKRGNRG
jgi:hypothetical protein